MGGMARLLRKVSLPRALEHPVRTALTVGGVMLGVAVLIAVVLINRSVIKSIQAAVDDISGKADLQVSAGSGGIDEKLMEVVRAVPGVFKVAPVIQQNVRIATRGLEPRLARDLEDQDLVILGVHMLGDDDYFRSYGSKEIDEIKADPLVFLNSSSNIILSDKFSRKYGFKVHDTIALMTPGGKKDFEIWGFIRDEKLGHAMGGGLSVMFYQAAQVVFGRGSQVDRFDVAVDKEHDVAAVRASILKALGPGFEVDRPDRRTDRLTKMLYGFNLALIMGSALTMLLGMFLIFNTVSISVLQRRHEIGILRAIGATRRQVLNLFILEGAMIGAAGSGLGIVAGLVLARFLLVAMTRSVSEVYLRIHVDEVNVDGLLIAVGAALGVVSTLVSAIWPARQATRVDPVETLRNAAVSTVGPQQARRVTALDLIAVTLALSAAVLSRLPPVGARPLPGYAAIFSLVLGFAALMPRALVAMQAALRPIIGVLGVEAQVANENLGRALGRAAVTTGALMAAVATVVTFGVLVSSFQDSALKWIDQSVAADLRISTANPLAIGTSNSHMSNDMYDTLVHLPGVEAVDRLRIVDVTFRDTQIKLLSIDWKVLRHHTHFTYMAGSAESVEKPLLAGMGVIISDNLARRYGYKLNDPLSLPTPSGTREFQVAAIIVDYTSDQGMVLMHRDPYYALWQDDLVDTYKVYVHKGADLGAIRRAISARYGRVYNLYILSNAELKKEFTNVLNQVFQIIYILEVVALIIAILGVVNTMLAAVLDRMREIGVLRAIGATRRQVRKLIVIEAAIIGLASGLAGVVAGVLCGLIMLYSVNTVQSGWLFPFTMPVATMVQTTALVLIAAALAGWYPAGVAARIPIASTIKYE